MKLILSKLLGRAGYLLDVQPVLALFLAGALLAVFLTALFAPNSTPEPNIPARIDLLREAIPSMMYVYDAQKNSFNGRQLRLRA